MPRKPLKTWLTLLLALTVPLGTVSVDALDPAGAEARPHDGKPRAERPRVVVTTDGEGDDIASMHRFLLYANDFDVEGIVTSASRWHWAGDPTATPPINPNRWHGTTWIPALIDGLYRQAHPTLIQHDARYPAPERLLSVIKTGNITAGGEMAKDTEGSDLIKRVLLDDRPGPVYLQAWGGTNTIAAALRSIRDEYYGTPRWNKVYRKVSDKAVIYVIQDQDLTYKEYIAKAWPQVGVLMNREQFEAFAYGSWLYTPQPQLSYLQKNWISANIQKGPYAATYPVHGGVEGNSICRGGCALGDWFSEGDSPSFLHTIPTGLRQLEDPTYGGWGGRFVRVNDRVWADDPAYLGGTRPKATDLSPYPILNTTLAAAAPAGSTNVKVARVRQPGGGIHSQTNDFLAGDTVSIGTGAEAETRTLTRAGGGGAGPTTLFDAAPAGARNVQVTTVSNYFVGDPLTIGTGDTAQTVTVTHLGTQRVATTAAAAAAQGDTVLKVASTGAACNANAGACFTDPVMRPGDHLRITTGDSQFTVTIKAVGTPFASGSGITLERPLPVAVPAGTAVVDPGSGITFNPALAAAQAAGTTAQTLGGGLTIDRPLTRDHAQGAAVANYNSPGWPQARWTDAVQNDMAARIDWTYKGFADANHAPVPWVQSCAVTAKPGRRVHLNGKAWDPDGDKVRLAWYQYPEAGTYPGRIALQGSSTRTPSFVMPKGARPGQTVHVILAVTDEGATPITRYRRVIVTAAGSGRDTTRGSQC